MRILVRMNSLKKVWILDRFVHATTLLCALRDSGLVVEARHASRIAQVTLRLLNQSPLTVELEADLLDLSSPSSGFSDKRWYRFDGRGHLSISRDSRNFDRIHYMNTPNHAVYILFAMNHAIFNPSV